jgi:glucokinase
MYNHIGVEEIDMKYTFGIDVGGTNIKIGLFEVGPFRLIDKREISTPKYNHATSIFEVTKKNMTELLDLHHMTYNDIHGVGFAIPCPVKNGYVVKCPNLKWESLDVISSMRSLLEPHIKVVVSNDANIAAYGENYSLDVPLQNAIFYTLGTGVGGGIIIDGKIVEGRTGAGGEIGHMQIFEHDEICGCGKSGCLEQICGTKAILDYAKELSNAYESSIDFKHITVKDVFDAAKKNDPVGFRVLDRVAKYIALSASILSVSLDPDIIIIGGGIAKAGQILIDQILKHYRVFARFGTVDIPFVLAKTGNDAGIIGAAKYTI